MAKETPPVVENDAEIAADFFGVDPDKVPAEVRLHPILSNEQVAAAREKARQKIERERELAAIRQVEDEEVARLRREEGLVSGVTSEDELVWVTIDVPEWVPWIATNGHPYWAGYPYQVPRHVARTLQEQMQNAWRTHDSADGKSLADMFKSRRATNINGATGAIHNAPARFDA